MGSTRVSDIIEPTIFVPYVEEQTVLLSRLIRSGIVVPDPQFDILATTGGLTINMPFFKDLTGADEVLSSGTGATDSSLTPGAITSGTDIAAIFQRGRAWGVEDLAAAIAGSDPMAAIGNMVAGYWNYREQQTLLSTLKGLFADNNANDSGDLILDVSIADGDNAADANLIGANAIIDASAKLGDAGVGPGGEAGGLTALCMHSIPYSKLMKLNLIDFTPEAGQNVGFGTYLGKSVIVDDNCPTTSGGTSGTIYTTYLFGRGAIARGDGKPKVPFEMDRDSLAGVDLMIHRRHFILHPRGIAFSASAASITAASPSNTEVESLGFWNRVYEKKNIRLVKLLTNG